MLLKLLYYKISPKTSPGKLENNTLVNNVIKITTNIYKKKILI